MKNSTIVAKVVENDTHARPKLEKPICKEIIVEQCISPINSVYRLFSHKCRKSNTYSRETAGFNTCTDCKTSHQQFVRRFATWANREEKKKNEEHEEQEHDCLKERLVELSDGLGHEDNKDLNIMKNSCRMITTKIRGSRHKSLYAESHSIAENLLDLGASW